MSSLKLVFVLQIQQNMDCYVQAWNNHRVRSINDNGRSILSHVPEAAFQMHEHLFNELGPPRVVYCVVTDPGQSERRDEIGMITIQHCDGPCHFRDGHGKWPVCTITRGQPRWIFNGHVS